MHIFLPKVLIAFGLAIACVPSQAHPVALEIVGTGDGIDLLRALGRDFMQQHSNVRVEIPPSIGSGGGIAAVGARKAVLGRVAVKLSDADREVGINYRPFARLPSAFYVNPAVGVDSVTAEQLADIYSGKVLNWKDLGGSDLRIRVVRREDSDSTLTVLRATMPGWKDLNILERSKMATTTQEAIETVREVAGAIGFGPYAKNLEQALTVLKIDGRHPTDAGYPSSVELALIYSDSTITPAALSFIEFSGSERARNIILSFGSVPAQSQSANE
jgi:phosphate transport system substrate-binding protein